MENCRKKENFKEGKSFSGRDYKIYQWKWGERAAAIFGSVGIVWFLAQFFYRSVYGMIPLLWIGHVIFHKIGVSLGKIEREKLREEFGEYLLSISVLLQAGYSVENAFVGCYGDMVMLYGEKGLICQEIVLIRNGLAINLSLETILVNLGNRSGVEEISQFGEVFGIAKRSGGNVPAIMKNTAGQIARKLDMRREMKGILAGRQFEFNFMKITPFVIPLYLELSNPGYFDSLYGNVKGILIMSMLLGIYLTAYCLGEKVFEKLMRE